MMSKVELERISTILDAQDNDCVKPYIAEVSSLNINHTSSDHNLRVVAGSEYRSFCRAFAQWRPTEQRRRKIIFSWRQKELSLAPKAMVKIVEYTGIDRVNIGGGCNWQHASLRSSTPGQLSLAKLLRNLRLGRRLAGAVLNQCSCSTCMTLMQLLKYLMH
jgi:hypothetical protein